jgi:hypothetical protein
MFLGGLKGQKQGRPPLLQPLPRSGFETSTSQIQQAHVENVRGTTGYPAISSVLKKAVHIATSVLEWVRTATNVAANSGEQV